MINSLQNLIKVSEIEWIVVDGNSEITSAKDSWILEQVKVSTTQFISEPDEGIGGRASYWPRGKVIGGSSSINAMVYIRGHQGDFDDWEAMGNTGWGWNDVLPYFKKAETSDQGEDEWHGGEGPLHVTTLDRDLHPLCQNYIRAGVECGLDYNDDFNGVGMEGVGLYRNTSKGGFRMSAARAYLHPANKRHNLTVMTNAHSTRILIEDKKAVGVEYVRHGETHQVTAAREVIVSAGAVNSPQLLQLSGVGPAGLLKRLQPYDCNPPVFLQLNVKCVLIVPARSHDLKALPHPARTVRVNHQWHHV